MLRPCLTLITPDYNIPGPYLIIIFKNLINLGCCRTQGRKYILLSFRVVAVWLCDDEHATSRLLSPTPASTQQIGEIKYQDGDIYDSARFFLIPSYRLTIPGWDCMLYYVARGVVLGTIPMLVVVLICLILLLLRWCSGFIYRYSLCTTTSVWSRVVYTWYTYNYSDSSG